jgi:putative FmdB family regulatory protein
VLRTGIIVGRMPTYEYACSRCKATYELRQGFDAPNTHTCEECGKGKAKRVLHAPRVVFKGSGWYVTDSKKSQSAVADTTTSDGDSGDSGTTTETKSEPAKASKSEKPTTTDAAAS